VRHSMQLRPRRTSFQFQKGISKVLLPTTTQLPVCRRLRHPAPHIQLPAGSSRFRFGWGLVRQDVPRTRLL
jgi:hypothetical protein